MVELLWTFLCAEILMYSYFWYLFCATYLLLIPLYDYAYELEKDGNIDIAYHIFIFEVKNYVNKALGLYYGELAKQFD